MISMLKQRLYIYGVTVFYEWEKVQRAIRLNKSLLLNKRANGRWVTAAIVRSSSSSRKMGQDGVMEDGRVIFSPDSCGSNVINQFILILHTVYTIQSSM